MIGNRSGTDRLTADALELGVDVVEIKFSAVHPLECTVGPREFIDFGFIGPTKSFNAALNEVLGIAEAQFASFGAVSHKVFDCPNLSNTFSKKPSNSSNFQLCSVMFILASTMAMPWSIDILVSLLRKKLESDPKKPKVIKTIHGIGYMFTL